MEGQDFKKDKRYLDGSPIYIVCLGIFVLTFVWGTLHLVAVKKHRDAVVTASLGKVESDRAFTATGANLHIPKIVQPKPGPWFIVSNNGKQTLTMFCKEFYPVKSAAEPYSCKTIDHIEVKKGVAITVVE